MGPPSVLRLTLAFERQSRKRNRSADGELAVHDRGGEQLATAARRGTRWAVLISLGLHAGLRLGDALGLTWNDVDFDAGLIKVRRQLDSQTGELRELKTKAAKREIPISSAIRRLLLEWKLESLYALADHPSYRPRPVSPCRTATACARWQADVKGAATPPDLAFSEDGQLLAVLVEQELLRVRTRSKVGVGSAPLGRAPTIAARRPAPRRVGSIEQGFHDSAPVRCSRSAAAVMLLLWALVARSADGPDRVARELRLLDEQYGAGPSHAAATSIATPTPPKRRRRAAA